MATLAERPLYSRVGVDTEQADAATDALVAVLQTITSSPQGRSVIPSGHYAAVLPLGQQLGLALSTDGVGSKAIVAEKTEDFSTIGIDCVAMNVNDVICVGARPIAMLDYLSVGQAEPEVLRQIGLGLKAGAEEAGITIPGGEVAQLPEMVRSHGSSRGSGFDLVGACVGTVGLDSMLTGARARAGDVIIGLPANGVHANGLTLARHVLPDLRERPPELAGATVGETLLTPTLIYVEQVADLLASPVDVRGLAHITSNSFRNLLRLHGELGYRITSLLPVPPVFDLIGARAQRAPEELWEVFNMGCGFCCIVPEHDAAAALERLSAFEYRGTAASPAIVGEVTDRSGIVELEPVGLMGTKDQRLSASPSSPARPRIGSYSAR